MKKTQTNKALSKATIKKNNETSDLDLTKSGSVSKRSQPQVEFPAYTKQAMPKLLIAAIVGLVMLIALVVYMNQSKNRAAADQTPSINKTTPDAALSNRDDTGSADTPSTINAPLSTDVSTDSSDETAVISAEVTASDTGLAEYLEETSGQDILSAPIPQSDALVKEEIQRMEDEHVRLQEQEALLNEQMMIVENINHKKEEQIALLEQRVAQLETAQ